MLSKKAALTRGEETRSARSWDPGSLSLALGSLSTHSLSFCFLYHPVCAGQRVGWGMWRCRRSWC